MFLFGRKKGGHTIIGAEHPVWQKPVKGKRKRKGALRFSENCLHPTLCSPFVYERLLKKIFLCFLCANLRALCGKKSCTSIEEEKQIPFI
jgi:hypothetical protein